jgi:hypothetical protein
MCKIGTAAAQFPEKEYINVIFLAVHAAELSHLTTLQVLHALLEGVYIPNILHAAINACMD